MKHKLYSIMALVLLTTSCKLLNTSTSESVTKEAVSEKIITVDIKNVITETCKQAVSPLKINLTSTAFSKDKVMLLAAFSDTVYKTINYEYEKIIREWGFFNVIRDFEKTTGAEFIIAANNDVIIVAFAGSNQIIDWLKNSDAKPTGTLHFNGLAHKGMIDGFESALPNLTKELTTLVSKINRPIVFTGHSLGGAHALLAAQYFDLKNADSTYTGPKFNVNAVYTFGQPRVGNKTFAAQITTNLKERYIRTYNGYDPIGHLFPRSRTSIEQMKTVSPSLFGVNEWGVDLNMAEYTHPASLIVKLREPEKGAVLTTTEEEAASDASYWNSAFEIVSKSRADAAKYIDDHISAKYLCNTLKLYNTL